MWHDPERVLIRCCFARYNRGWTAIQIREGDNLSCTGATIEDNVIVSRTTVA